MSVISSMLFSSAFLCSSYVSSFRAIVSIIIGVDCWKVVLWEGRLFNCNVLLSSSS